MWMDHHTMFNGRDRRKTAEEDGTERERCDQSWKGIINLFKFKKNIFKCKIDARGEK